MPVHRSRDRRGSFYQWGGHGKRYYYQVGNARSRLIARRLAQRQGAAAYSNGYREGSGVLDVLRAGYQAVRRHLPGFRAQWSPSVRSELARYGTERVVRLEVRRAPIISAVNKALNLITLGGISRVMKSLGYDTLYHLYLVAHLASGRALRMERNHVVEVYPWKGDNAEARPIALYAPVTLESLLNRAAAFAERHGDNIHVYHAGTANCQKFVSQVLNASGLMTPALSQWINQDAETLIAKQNPIARAIISGTTNLAHKADVVLKGQGRRRRPLARRARVRLLY